VLGSWRNYNAHCQFLLKIGQYQSIQFQNYFWAIKAIPTLGIALNWIVTTLDETGHASHVDNDTSFACTALLVLLQHDLDLLLHAQERAFLVDIVHEVHVV
jgi:hypothetical protein